MDRELEARFWIEAVVGEKLVEGANSDELLGEDKLYEALKDGIFICKLANKVTKSQIKPAAMKSMFTHKENIHLALAAFRNYGVLKTDLFEVEELYDMKAMNKVINAMCAISKKAKEKDFDGPILGEQTPTSSTSADKGPSTAEEQPEPVEEAKQEPEESPSGEPEDSPSQEPGEPEESPSQEPAEATEPASDVADVPTEQPEPENPESVDNDTEKQAEQTTEEQPDASEANDEGPTEESTVEETKGDEEEAAAE